MKCSQSQLVLDEIGDMDRLPSDVARHVAACAECERFGTELIALRSLLREPPRVAAPDTFEIGLARRLRAAKSTPPSRLALLWSLRPQTSLVAAAAFLFVCSGALVVSRYATTPEPGSSPIVVATNRSVSSEASVAKVDQGVPTFVQPAPIEPSVQVASVDSAEPERAVRAVGRPRGAARDSLSSDAMLLVIDDEGSRIVDVPRILVGSEMIVPVSDGGLGEASDTVSF